MGICQSSTSETGATKAEQIPEAKHKRPFSKKSRIVVVGAGPAGIHAAATLRKRGYANVVVLEKAEDDGTFGKTCTHFLEETGDVPHEMGTAYLAWSYHRIRDLFKEYVGADALVDPGGGSDGPYGKLLLPAPHLSRQAGERIITSDEWVEQRREELTIPKDFWNVVPNDVQKAGFLADAIKYRDLHVSLFGEYSYHGLPPKPSLATLERIDMTFREFMIKHELHTLLDLCVVGYGSYGYSYDVPALYGLWFVTPRDVFSFLLAKFDSDIKTVQMVRNGYRGLWAAMKAKEKVQVRYGVKIAEIDRQLSDPKKPVLVKLEDGSVEEYDFCVFAAPMQSAFKALVKDKTEFETKMCDSIETVGLVVNLLRTEKKAPYDNDGTPIPEQALVFYPESLQPTYVPDPSGQVYAERNNVLSYAWKREAEFKHRYVAAYQYYRKGQTDPDKCLRDAVAFITDRAVTMNPTPTEPSPPTLLYQKNWQEYFPHFSADGVRALMPWKVFEEQGLRKTFYLGSSVSFESVEDVVNYTEQVFKMNGV